MRALPPTTEGLSYRISLENAPGSTERLFAAVQKALSWGPWEPAPTLGRGAIAGPDHRHIELDRAAIRPALARLVAFIEQLDLLELLKGLVERLLGFVELGLEL